MDEEQEEFISENVEAQNEAQEDYAEDNSPTYEKAEDLYSLFYKTIVMQDSSKVANLDKQELGMLDISVRDCQNIAEVARLLEHKGFSNWMNEQAQIILRTSASKKGWLTELFVSAKRFSSKEKKLGLPKIQEQKKSFWNKK